MSPDDRIYARFLQKSLRIQINEIIQEILKSENVNEYPNPNQTPQDYIVYSLLIIIKKIIRTNLNTCMSCIISQEIQVALQNNQFLFDSEENFFQIIKHQEKLPLNFLLCVLNQNCICSKERPQSALIQNLIQEIENFHFKIQQKGQKTLLLIQNQITEIFAFILIKLESNKNKEQFLKQIKIKNYQELIQKHYQDLLQQRQIWWNQDQENSKKTQKIINNQNEKSQQINQGKIQQFLIKKDQSEEDTQAYTNTAFNYKQSPQNLLENKPLLFPWINNNVHYSENFKHNTENNLERHNSNPDWSKNFIENFIKQRAENQSQNWGLLKNAISKFLPQNNHQIKSHLNEHKITHQIPKRQRVIKKTIINTTRTLSQLPMLNTISLQNLNGFYIDRKESINSPEVSIHSQIAPSWKGSNIDLNWFNLDEWGKIDPDCAPQQSSNEVKQDQYFQNSF